MNYSLTPKRDMQAYLRPSQYIDFEQADVLACAHALANQATSEQEIAQRCFEFVRDKIRHSVDFKQNPVTCKASDTLRYQTGYCYAKSHLLAALLRANAIPAGLCYQRLSVSDQGGAPYCLHGLNAIYLQGMGWYRVDARGNKPGINAQFSPPQEMLAFKLHDTEERDLPEIWAEPLPVVVAALTRHSHYEQVLAHLPDITL